MGVATKIEWTDHTFNPWWGCTRVSPGCEHCYAETFSKRIGLKVWGTTAERRFFGAKHWAEPYRWDKAAERDGARRRVFCASMADVCEDHRDPRVQAQLNGARRQLARVITDTPHLDWLLLTKRVENFREVLPVELFDGHKYPRNIWPGTTAEDQPRLEARIGHLLDLREFPVRFLSCEPLIDGLTFRSSWLTGHDDGACAKSDPGCDGSEGDCHDACESQPRIDWVIVGGESGPGARPCDIFWLREIRNQCRLAFVPVFIKQLGARSLCASTDTTGGGEVVSDANTAGDCLAVGREIKFRDRKGGDPEEWPADLRVREFPRAVAS